MIIDNSEKTALLQAVSSAPTDDITFEAAKAKFIMEMTQAVNETKSMDELNIMKKKLISTRPIINACRDQVSCLPSTSRTPGNKLIIPQRRLFSTKKKNKRKKQNLNKPSAEETNIIAAKMILESNN